MPQENNDILRAISELQNTIKDLNHQVSVQNQKIRELDSRLSAERLPDLAGQAAVPPPPPPPPPPVLILDKEKDNDLLNLINRIDKVSAVESNRPSPIMDKGRSHDSPAVQPAVAVNRAKDKDIALGGSLEERIGGRWFAKIGMAVVILGLSFFLKYAFDNGWVNPTGKVLIGIFCGLIMLYLGERTIRRYSLYGQILSGGGLAALYLSIYAAFNFYSLIGSLAAFGLMAVITGVAIALSLRYDAQSLIIVALLGGFATPYLVSSHVNNQVGLFSYIIILDLAVLFVSVFKNWRWLQLSGFLGTFILFQGWYAAFYSVDQLFSTLFFLTVFFIIYSLSALFYNLIRKEGSTGYEQLLAMFSGLAYFGACYGLLNADFHDLLAVLTVVLAVYYLLWAYLAKELTPKDDSLYNFLAFLSISFVTIAIPLQFKAYTVTISWLVEATLLMFLGAKQYNPKGDILKNFGFFVYFISVWRIISFYPEYGINDWLFFNKFFITSLIAIASAYIAAFCFRKFAGSADASQHCTTDVYMKTVRIFMIIASLLTIFAVSRDIGVWHKNLIAKERATVDSYNRQIKQNLVYNYQDQLRSYDDERIGLLSDRSNVLISIFILVYSFFIIGWGLLSGLRYLVSLGLILNAIIILKLFLHDFWEINSSYRALLSLTAVVGAYFNALLFSGRVIKTHNFEEAKKFMFYFILAANLLTVVAVSREISVYHEKLISAMGDSSYVVSGQTDLGRVNFLHERASVLTSIFVVFYSLFMLVWGLAYGYSTLAYLGIGFSILVLIKLFFNDLWIVESHYRSLLSFIAVAGAYLSALFLSGRVFNPLNFGEAKKYLLLFVILANVLSVFAVSREISLHYERLAAAVEQGETADCQALGKYIGSYDYSESENNELCGQYMVKVKKLNNQASVSISIFWLLYAIVLTAIGFAKRLKGVRLGGMALLLFAIAKLFFYDLWSLGQLYRIIASISLGLVLLGISFAYQKYKEVFREIIA